jgi:hypothetical protein
VNILFPHFAVHGCVIAPSDLLEALTKLSEELGPFHGKADACLDFKMDFAFLVHSFSY